MNDFLKESEAMPELKVYSDEATDEDYFPEDNEPPEYEPEDFEESYYYEDYELPYDDYDVD